MSELVCPGCGEPAEYRLRRRLAEQFEGATTYLCLPDGDEHAYAHRVPAEQALTVAYPWMEASP